MKKMKRIFVFVILGLTFAACNNNVAGPSMATNSSFIPLSTSNKWVSLVTKYDSLGNVLSSYSDSTQFEDTVISNIVWYHTKNNDYAYANSDSGVITRLIGEKTNSHIYLSYKYPVVRGECFASPSLACASLGNAWLVDTAYHTLVLSTDTVITVPAGSYHCIGYQTKNNDTNTTWSTIEYISPHYGWIKAEVCQSYNSGKNIICLGTIETTKIIIQ
jgi:hypothetical protein